MSAVTLQPKDAHAPKVPTYGDGAQGRLSVSGSVTLPNGGTAGPVKFTPGTRFDVGATVDNGVPSALEVRKSAGSASAFGIASLEGAQLKGGQIEAGVRIFDMFKISKDITSDVIGTSRVPGTANELRAALLSHKQDGVSGDFTADVRITPTAPGRTVSFGNDSAFAFDAGTTAKVTRRGSTTTYDIDANLRQASIGTAGAGQFTSGAGHMHFQAVETKDRHGKSMWSVQIVNAARMHDAHLSMPTNDGQMNKLDIGELEVNGTAAHPVLTSQGGRITGVNMHAKVTGLNGVINLGDQASGRNAELRLKSRTGNGAPLSVDADISMKLVPRANRKRGEDEYDHDFGFHADMKNVDAHVDAKKSIGLINGEGFHADLGDGTAITGSGVIDVTRKSGSTSVSINAPQGLSGAGVLKNIKVQRQLREYGIDLRIPEAKVTTALGTLDSDKGIFKGSATFGAFTELAGLSSPSQRTAVSNFMTQIALKGNDDKALPLVEGTLSALMTGTADKAKAPGIVMEPTAITAEQRAKLPASYNDMLSRFSGTLAVNNGGSLKLDAPFAFARDGGMAITGAKLAIRDATVDSVYASAAVLSGQVALPKAPDPIVPDAVLSFNQRFAAAGDFRQMPIAAAPNATAAARADLIAADKAGPAALPPLQPLPPIGAQPDLIKQLNLPQTLDLPKALGTTLREADVYGSYTTPDHDTTVPLTMSPVGFSAFGYRVSLLTLHPTLTIPANTRIDLGIQSAPQGNGPTQFTRQAATTPDGQPNPNAGQMSGIRFSKPLVVNELGNRIEINGINFVPQVKDGKPTGEFDVSVDMDGDKSSTWFPGINGMVTGAVQKILSSKTGKDHNSLTVSEFASAVTKAFDLHVDPDTNILDDIRKGMPAEARPLFDDVIAKGHFSAHGVTQSDVTLNTAGQQLTLRKGAQVTVHNGPNGALHATADGDFGRSVLQAGGSSVSFDSATASLAVDNVYDAKGHPITTLKMSDVSADGLSLDARTSEAQAKLEKARVQKASIAMRVSGTDTPDVYEGALAVNATGVHADNMHFKRKDGTTFAIADGNAATLTIDAAGLLDTTTPTDKTKPHDKLKTTRGVVTASGLTGSFTADGNIRPDGFETRNGQPIRYSIRSGTLTGGALNFDMIHGHIVAPEPLKLTNFDASMGNLPIRHDDQPMPMMDLRQLDIKARAATVAFDGQGVEVKPVDSKAIAWGSASFQQQEPYLSVQAPQITARAAVDSWRMSFDGKYVNAALRNVYATSNGNNVTVDTAVPISDDASDDAKKAAAATKAPVPPAPVVHLTNTSAEIYADTLGFELGPDKKTDKFWGAATALLSTQASMPAVPVAANSPSRDTVTGTGTGTAQLSVVMTSDGNYRMTTKANIAQADFTASMSMNPAEAKKAAVRAARAVVSRLPGSVLAPQDRVSPDTVREKISKQAAPALGQPLSRPQTAPAPRKQTTHPQPRPQSPWGTPDPQWPKR